MNKEFYTVKEFATKLEVSVQTIRRAIRLGRIQGFRPGHGKKAPYRIPVSEIDRIVIMDLKETTRGLINAFKEQL